ncbi:DUF6364 family protein [Bifidobacterium parmae]|uniref:Toxin-antitoxin system protein n=1 Tax=Bifidobacterium parmae TaxID=361854 RepID=A0A2N5IYY1_9BIFI|nr:DUF6364 family protein [Bifidobacterium parmae]PLS27163.1 hypothetical protein Uis4E_1749 [Bifidobacterium parmae]
MGKLTLSIDERVIENGKRYAEQQSRMLSSPVESYLESLQEEGTSTRTSPAPRRGGHTNDGRRRLLLCL